MSEFAKIIETDEYKGLCKLKPLFDKVAVVRLPEKDQTESGLYIAETAKEKTCTGVIVGAGDQCVYVKQGGLLWHGDEITFGVYAGVELPEIGKNALILREEEILAKKVGDERPKLAPPLPPPAA